MTKKLELYRCNLCGNIVEVIYGSSGELVCCGENMELLESQNSDGDLEKHVPVFETSGDELEVRIGATPHPMTNEHHIHFIECISLDEKYLKRKYLDIGEDAVLKLKCYDIGNLKARELCNIHGLFESQYKKTSSMGE